MITKKNKKSNELLKLVKLDFDFDIWNGLTTKILENNMY